MKKHLLFVSILVATLIAPLAFAVAAPDKTARSSLLAYYDRIPGKHFAGFGGVNRRSLLKRKGAIVDYKRKFIEIPGSDEGNGDLEKLQISLFPNGNAPWVAVSRIVWPQDRTPGTLNFYSGNYKSNGNLREAIGLFPYKLHKRSGSDIFENAYLPRKGLTIQIVDADVHSNVLEFKYNPKAQNKKSYFVRIK